MKNMPNITLNAAGSHARLRIWLTIGYALFIIYASVTPFSGWREQGFDYFEVLGAPLLLTFTAFDAIVNLLSYLPFGLLAGLALRAHFGTMKSVMLGLCSGVMLSATMEYLQMYLPARISSNMDLITNGLGTLVGLLLAVGVASRPQLLARLTLWRSSLFNQGKEMDFGLALLVLWMFGQINPSLPMLGNLFIGEIARQPFAALPYAPFDWWASCAVTLNLLMLGTLVMTLLHIPRNIVTALPIILSIVALSKFVAAAVLLKSRALLLWINSEAVLGMLFGILLLFAALWLPRNRTIVSGAVVALIYFAVVNFVFTDNSPAIATSIYHWHYGHLLNYNGLAQTITLTFPLLLILYLLRIKNI